MRLCCVSKVAGKKKIHCSKEKYPRLNWNHTDSLKSFSLRVKQKYPTGKNIYTFKYIPVL
jgi:hypothetical protein